MISPTLVRAILGMPAEYAARAIDWLIRNPDASRYQQKMAVEWFILGARDFEVVDDLTPYRGTREANSLGAVDRVVIYRPGGPNRRAAFRFL